MTKKLERVNRYRYLWIDVTLDCNLRCKYCDNYVSEKASLDEDLIFSNAVNAIKKYSDKDVRFNISGGEPVLYPKLQKLLDIINHSSCHGVTLYSNGMKPIPNFQKEGKENFIHTSFHLDYPKCYNTIVQNVEKSGMPCIYNILVKEFDEYPNFRELEEVLDKIRDQYVHIQYICDKHSNNAGTLDNYLKFQEYLEERGLSDCFDLSKIENFYNHRSSICTMNSWKLSGDKLIPECPLCTDEFKIQIKRCREYKERLHEFLYFH